VRDRVRQTDRRQRVKSFPSHKAHRATLISRFLSAQPDTRLHCETTDTGLAYRAVCLFTHQLLLVLTAPTHGGMARLSWPGWLVTYRDGLPVRRRSPIQVGPTNRARCRVTSLITTNALPHATTDRKQRLMSSVVGRRLAENLTQTHSVTETSVTA